MAVDDVDWPRWFWIGFGVVLAGTLLFVLYSFIGTFVFGIFLYYATRPLFDRVNRHVRHRTLAALLSLTLLALPIIVLLYYTMAIALQEFNRFAATTDVSPISAAIQPYIDVSSVVENPQALLADTAGTETVVQTVTQLLDYLGLVGTGLVHAFVMLAFAFYLLRDGPRLVEWSKTFLDRRGNLDRYFHEVDQSFDRVFYGNILNAIVTGAIGAIAFSLVNFFAPTGLSVPYPALTGLLAGAASLIPIIGMKIVYVPIAGYLAVEASIRGDGWWFVGLFVGVALVIVDTIPDLLIRPYVSGGGSLPLGFFGSTNHDSESDDATDATDESSGLHTGTLMFAYILGPFLFGWYGIFLAPMILVLVVHFARFVLPEIVTGNRIRPYAVDPTNLVEAETADEESSGERANESNEKSTVAGE